MGLVLADLTDEQKKELDLKSGVLVEDVATGLDERAIGLAVEGSWCQAVTDDEGMRALCPQGVRIVLADRVFPRSLVEVVCSAGPVVIGAVRCAHIDLPARW